GLQAGQVHGGRPSRRPSQRARGARAAPTSRPTVTTCERWKLEASDVLGEAPAAGAAPHSSGQPSPSEGPCRSRQPSTCPDTHRDIPVVVYRPQTSYSE